MSLKTCCASGSLHTGIPQGKVIKVHKLDCYLAESPGPSKGIIVIIPDAFGWTLPNNRILADDYAKNGFTVYLPDFGAFMPADMMTSFKALSATGLWNQLYKLVHIAYMIRYFAPFWYYNRPSVAAPKIYDFMKALKANEGANMPIGTAGFCWGGYFVTQLCHDKIKADDGTRLTVCGFVAHPSLLSFPGDIDPISLPYSCAAPEHDAQMSPDNAKLTKEILTAKTAKTKDQGVEHEFVMYPGVNHGFAVRADEDEKEEAEAGKKAEEQAVKWFARWFEQPPP